MRPGQSSKPSLLSMAEALRDYPAVSVDESLGQRVSSGQVMATDELAAKGDGPWAVLGPQGQLLAVYKPHTSGMVKPEVVIPQ